MVTTDQLIDELERVTSREKLRKYFSQEKVSELTNLLKIISVKFKINKIDKICRDPKDDFLLALCRASNADFLITCDKDLLEIGTYGQTEILTVNSFKERFK